MHKVQKKRTKKKYIKNDYIHNPNPKFNLMKRNGSSEFRLKVEKKKEFRVDPKKKKIEQGRVTKKLIKIPEGVIC